MFNVGRGSAASKGKSDTQLKSLNCCHQHSISSSNTILGCKLFSLSCPLLLTSSYLVNSPHIESRYSKEELEVSLAFCDKFGCDITKDFVARRIEAASWCFHPAELLNLATTYQLPMLFHQAFHGLTNLSLTQLSKAHHLLISSDLFTSLALTKAVVDEHCRIIATKEPHILMHANNCQDPTACEVDWHGVWWNGMGCYLLDGRNPQPYDEAVRQFRLEAELGRMGKGCKEKNVSTNG